MLWTFCANVKRSINQTVWYQWIFIEHFSCSLSKHFSLECQHKTEWLIFRFFPFLELFFFLLSFSKMCSSAEHKSHGNTHDNELNKEREKETNKKKNWIEWRHLHSMQNFRQKKHRNCVQLISIEIKLEMFDGMAYSSMYICTQTTARMYMYTDHVFVWVDSAISTYHEKQRTHVWCME